ncbi:unnamed protein product [Linum tenue]|uniref:Uncharacterized protein n=1 Tax=Linum tenue TaxID=586396 RepID=A0AAV0QDF9_9ROSI|nr:unnamed protein product [Linum tenue]
MRKWLDGEILILRVCCAVGSFIWYLIWIIHC